MEEAWGVAATFDPQAKAQPQTEKLVDSEQNDVCVCVCDEISIFLRLCKHPGLLWDWVP